MAKKRRIRLQPNLPRLRRRKEEDEEWEGSEAPADAPREHAPDAREHPENKRKVSGWRKSAQAFKPDRLKDRKLLIWIVIILAAVIVILIILWIYPMTLPKPPKFVSDSDVRQELERLKGINAYPANRNINPADYPKTLGVFFRNNLTLEERYFCSDVCPDYGRVDLVFQGVDNEACAGSGGKSLHDLAWGGYIGCQPKVE